MFDVANKTSAPSDSWTRIKNDKDSQYSHTSVRIHKHEGSRDAVVTLVF